ncbi:MAG: amidase, partial [Clostridia bacterium]|nr:amidase [Clostridia bacterium]
RMIDEGAIIIGKANMSAGAEASRITYGWEVGETFNAYDPKMASGGSSGGGTVAVSLNFAAAGLGTDTGSSLRIPAVLNGCVTLRASRGLISMDGIVLLNKYRDTPGAITRNVDDLAVMLDVITDGSEDFAGALDGDALKGIRIGILKELTYATTLIGGRTKSHLDGEVQDTFAKTVEEMKSLGAEIVTVSIPNLFTLYNNAKDDSSSNVKKFRSTVESTLKNNGLSALIFPTYLNTPQETGYNSDGSRKIDDQDWLNNSIYVSPPTGCPEIGVTIGYHSRGPGIGMEILGATGSDRTLLGIAYAYTEAYNKREFPANNGQPENAKYSLSELTYLYLHPEARPQTTETETTPADTSIPDSAQSSRVVTSADITDVLTGGELTPNRGETVSRVLLVFVTAIAVIVLVLYIVRQINIRKNRRRAAARKKSRRKQ